MLPVMARKSQKQEHEAVDPTVSMARKRREDTGAQLISFLFSLDPLPIEWCCPHSRKIDPPHLTQSRNVLTDRPRGVSMVILSLTELTIQINHRTPSPSPRAYPTG